MSFRINVLPSEQEFLVEEEESVLDAALRQGVTFPYGCRNGVCGSCKGRVLEGRLEYPGAPPKALSERETASGWALFCQGRPLSDLSIEMREISAVKDIPVRTLPCRVDRLERLAHDVMAVYLKLPQNQRLQFLAGQYVDILLKDGRRRAFSLANAPHDDEHLELHVRNVPGGHFSDFVFTRLKEKTLFRINGPLGSFYLRDDSDRRALLVAGGTGFAPIKGMVEDALEKGSERPLHLYCGVRALKDLYMDELCRTWADAHQHIRYTPVLSEPDVEDRWTGRRGFVHAAVAEDYPDLSDHEVYASGPPVMCHAVRDSAFEQGLDPSRLFSDLFEYAYEDGHDG